MVDALLAGETAAVYALIDRRFADHFARWGFRQVRPGELPRPVSRTYLIGRAVTTLGSLLRRQRIRIVPLLRPATAIGIWSAVSGLAVAIGPGERRPAAAALLLELSLLRQRAGRGHRPGGGRPAAAGVAGQPRGPLRSARRGAAVAGIGLLVWTVIEAPTRGWTSPATRGGFAGTAVILAGFAFWQVRRPGPMLDVRLFATACEGG